MMVVLVMAAVIGTFLGSAVARSAELPSLTVPMELRVPEDFESIQDAIDAASDGDTILVGPGEYNEEIVFGVGPLTVVSTDGPERTKILPPPFFDMVTFRGAGSVVQIFEGFTVETVSSAAVFSDGASPLIRGNVFRTTNGVAVNIQSGNATIVGNRFDHGSLAVASGFRADTVGVVVIEDNRFARGGLRVSGAGEVVVRRNVFEQNQASAVRVSGTPDLTLENNLLVDNIALLSAGEGGVVLIQLVDGPTPVRLLNNTIASNVGPAVYMHGDTEQVEVVNNVFAPRPGHAAFHCTSRVGPATYRHNLFGESAPVFSNASGGEECPDLSPQSDGNTIADPGFVNEIEGDYQLLFGAAAVDAGAPDRFAANDFANRPRPLDGDLLAGAVPDIGFAELDPDEPSPTPTATPTMTETKRPTVTPAATLTPTPLRMNGVPCTSADECASGFCATVCCDEACDGIGEYCSLQGAEGACRMATPTQVPPPCPGDCTGNYEVRISELILAVNIALGLAPVDECSAADISGDGLVAINELVSAVRSVLSGCPFAPPTSTPFVPATATPQAVALEHLAIDAGTLLNDPFRGVLYVAVDRDDPVYANQIVEIEPISLEVSTFAAVDDEIAIMVLSDDGRFLYFSTAGSPEKITRIDVERRDVDLEFNLGRDGFSVFRAADIRTVPGRSSSVVVARVSGSAFRGVAVYDEGIQRGAAAGQTGGIIGFLSPGPTVLAFGDDASTLYGHDGMGSPMFLFTMRIDDSGVRFTNIVPDLYSSGQFPMSFADGRLFPTSDVVIDVSTQTVVYEYPFGFATPVVEPDRDRMSLISSSGRQQTLRILRLSDFTETASLAVDGVVRDSLVRWGGDGLAWIDSDGLSVARTALLSAR